MGNSSDASRLESEIKARQQAERDRAVAEGRLQAALAALKKLEG
jgi:flagellin-like hook-associated protein FlgL